MKEIVETQYSIGEVVKHKYLDFRGVIYDVDPEFNNTEEWYESIPAEIRPKKEQPFYHVFAENDQVFQLHVNLDEVKDFNNLIVRLKTILNLNNNNLRYIYKKVSKLKPWDTLVVSDNLT